jgi:hypothetical protein
LDKGLGRLVAKAALEFMADEVGAPFECGGSLVEFFRIEGLNEKQIVMGAFFLCNYQLAGRGFKIIAPIQADYPETLPISLQLSKRPEHQTFGYRQIGKPYPPGSAPCSER